MKTLLLSMSIALLFTVACQKTTVDIEETAQQVGDVMASIDESGGSGGTLSYNDKSLERLAPRSFIDYLQEKSVPSAYAATCALSNTFSSCTSNIMTRTFGGCTIGAATFEGTVALTWGGSSSNCTVSVAGDTITRIPAFTMTGRRGAILTVTKTGSVGQRLTWASGAGTSKVFTFTNDGIRRVLTSGSSTLFDFTTQTTSGITITGTRRTDRVMSGGTLRVTNNVSGTTCDYAPSAVTWTSTCTCASSGSWSGSCSDGKSSTITITGCGTADLTLGTDTQSLTFDRCYGI